MLLDFEDILKIHEQAIAAGLHKKRDQLLFGINLAYVAGLPDAGDPNGQLLSDLSHMNQDGEIAGGVVPLARWLRNAAFAQSVFPQRQAFFRSFADKAAAAAQNASTAPPVVLTHKERVIFVSDLLPIGFLTGAARTGKSVVRMTVPSLEGGHPRVGPASGTPLSYFGTGWLIGPKHIITNHHVINARSDGEAPAAASDFKDQALRATVEFDYDEENANTTQKLGVAALSAADSALDYAILELKDDPKRPPLPLWTRPIEFSDESRLPVNIIQHPGGQPKQIAIRNNLTADLRGNDLAYFTDTKGGSSGSAVCNDRWQVLALHKASTQELGRYEYQGKETAWVNVGTTIGKIVDHVKAKDANLWNSIQASIV